MRLSDVWGYLDDDVKRLLRTVSVGSERINTRRLLGALKEFPEERHAREVLRDALDGLELELPVPERHDRDPEPMPPDSEFSPGVHETLNFFRLHRIRSVDLTQLLRRLLEIGTGETVRALEEKAMLATMIEQLQDTS